MASMETASQLAQFDSTGSFLRTYGREGKGPGEFAYIRQVRTRGDSLYVLDQQLNRLTVLHEGRPVRVLSLAFRPLDFLPLDGGRTLFNGLRATQEWVGYPYHLAGADAEVIRSFGYDGSTVRFDIPFTGWRSLSPASRGFWAADVNRYKLEFWEDGSDQPLRLERAAEWFPPLERPIRGYSPNTPPAPMVRGLKVLGQDELLVVSVIPASDFAEGLRRLRESAHGDHYVIDDFGKVFDTVLEVINTRTRQVLVSRRIDAYTVSVLESGEVAVWRMSDANSFVDILQIDLRRRE